MASQAQGVLTRPAKGIQMTKSSKAVKLVQAAALAAVLVPLGSVAVETSSITYYGPSGGGVVSNTFDFVTYTFELTFDNVAPSAVFDVLVDNVITNQDAVTSRLAANFPGYMCVPIAGGTDCVDFEVTAPDPGSVTWSGSFDIFIHWDADTNSSFPNTPDDRIRMLHNRGDVPGNGFDTDITTLGSYELEPGLGGRDNNFQSFLIAQAPEATAVPEPATLLMVGSGLSGLFYQRRRRRRDPDPRSGT